VGSTLERVNRSFAPLLYVSRTLQMRRELSEICLDLTVPVSVILLPTMKASEQAKSYSKLDLFFVSAIILFLELALIRWFSAHILYLTFFTNVILLGSFLGLSLGCLSANRNFSLLRWAPIIFVISLSFGLLTHVFSGSLQTVVNVGNAAESPQVVFFGTEYFFRRDIAQVAVPMEVFCGVFFFLSALMMLGLGQEMGKAFNSIGNRLHAYMSNIGGSIAGIVAFGACSYWQLGPFWWFALVVSGVGYYLVSKRLMEDSKLSLMLLVVVPILGSLLPGMYSKNAQGRTHAWSPYYLVEHDVASKAVSVNNISHQQMIGVGQTGTGHPYAFPYLLQRDAGGLPFRDVLIIGSGTGNDVSRALQWGAQRVDAVDIDPVILGIGKKYHPDRPYQDPRVHIYQNDGRNFLRTANRKYDLIVYALVDSLVLHSSANNVRLESFLFTKEAFQDARRLLKEDGVFAMYNYFRQGWIVGRLSEMLTTVFGAVPLVFTLPSTDVVKPTSKGGFTLIIAGGTEHIARAFVHGRLYSLPVSPPPGPESDDGFLTNTRGDGAIHLNPAEVIQPKEVFLASDDWPFLYLERPMIPTLNIRGILVMTAVSLLLLVLFLRGAERSHGNLGARGQMFFLGAGFMLIETKSVVQMSLLFGSTWAVNSVVFLMILAMILAANALVLRLKPHKELPYYVFLFATLALNAVIPLNYFLSMSHLVGGICSGLLVFSPVLFAGIIFSASFKDTREPEIALGANIAGAMAGGLAEYSSTLLGFQYLVLVTIGFYFLSLVLASCHPKRLLLSSAVPE
jgi:SAM-dependent methyltransferase